MISERDILLKISSFAGARVRHLPAPLALFLTNAFICRELFRAEYIDASPSIEGSFIALSRWLLENPHDISWLPYWFGGMPWIDAYQPGFHVLVALIAAALRVSAARSYHLLAACIYCAGPVSFYWMCRALTGSRGFAFLAGLLYSTFSTSVVFPLVLKDIGSPFRSRRLDVITNYGDVPHLAVLALVPVVIVLLDRACRGGSRAALAGTALAMAACGLINWPGSIGLAMAVIAYVLAYARAQFFRAVMAGLLGYGLACPWIPPATLRKVFLAAQRANGNFVFTPVHAWIAFFFLPFLLLLAWLLRRLKISEFLQFCFLFALPPTVFLCSWTSWGFALLPQPFRWHLEFELAATGAVVFLGWTAVKEYTHARRALIAALVLFCAVQVYHYRDYARPKIQPVDVRNRLEYRVSQWLNAHLPGRRVFLPGSLSIWADAFADIPQFAGCCDQGVSNPEYRAALYTIYTGKNAGARDGANSVLWLKAFGVQAVETGGPGSHEIFHPFRNPGKFDRLLPVLWKDGADTLYAIPQRSPSLAHVLYRTSLVPRAPIHGLDEAPLLPYVRALDDPTLPLADFQWESRHSARVRANLSAGEVVSIQESYNPGWRATVNGKPAALFSDALGMIVVDPQCTGDCTIEISYAPRKLPAILTRVASAGAAAVAVLLLVS